MEQERIPHTEHSDDIENHENKGVDEVTLARRREVYVDSPYERLHAQQAERGEARTDIYADYDGTLRVPGHEQELRDFMRTAETEAYPVVVVTGNDLPAMEKNIASGAHDKPPVIIGSVGTEIFILQEDGSYKRDEEYRKMLLEERRYNRPELARAGADFINELADNQPNTEFNYQGTEVSPYRQGEEAYAKDPEAHADKVQEFKLSFHFFAETPEELAQVEQAAKAKFAGQEVVVCEELNYNRQHVGEARLKYCMDIVPITKDGAVTYLANLMNVERRVVAGDSGNDTKMILETEGAHGVVVGNARQELATAAGEAVVPKAGQRSFRRAKNDGRAVYFEQRLEPQEESAAPKKVGGIASLTRALRILQRYGRREDARKRSA